jgi:hypothetical protein
MNASTPAGLSVNTKPMSQIALPFTRQDLSQAINMIKQANRGGTPGLVVPSPILPFPESLQQRPSLVDSLRQLHAQYEQKTHADGLNNGVVDSKDHRDATSLDVREPAYALCVLSSRARRVIKARDLLLANLQSRYNTHMRLWLHRYMRLRYVLRRFEQKHAQRHA